MAHLLHIDSSVAGAQSTSRRLSARAARRWLAAHPNGTITFRDLAANPIPHFDAVTGLARMVPPEKRTRAEHLSFALSVELINEIKQADTVVLGLPLYNYGPPSIIKAWVDHLIAPGVSVDAQTNAGLLGDTDFIVLAARGGGYGPGTPREGWDHAEPWLSHALSATKNTRRAERYGSWPMTCATRRSNGAMPLLCSQRPNTLARWTSRAAK